ncbi:Major Facilitator Superfamily protein [Vibrio aerogenes CECT 7868]|uniref:Major Facilitator Superfamily protein n=1 Tax=Vibrio aerogenes CECT 7868 TaxID=1216006 RepID=A0A1M5UTI3_9VIBR|nr:MFS transporter [Vibrio aerogenes]SHH66289.1 Major Facilitator Superfamily protein [Vibrio aerogenes CECT 7868]
MQRNIPLFMTYAVCSRLFLFLPMMTIFFRETIGLSYDQIILVQVFFSVAVVTLEVPMGILADLFGRKGTLVCGAILSFISVLLFSLSQTAIDLYIASFLSGCSAAMISGTDSALFFESLESLGRKEEFHQYMGKIGFFNFLFVAFLSIPVGYVIEYNMRLPYFLTLIPVSLSFLCLLGMKDPFQTERKAGQGVLAHLRGAIKSLSGDRVLVTLIMSVTYFTFAMEYGNQTYQAFFREFNMDYTWFGYVFFAFSMLVSLSSKYSHVVTSWIGQERRALRLINLLIAVSLIWFGLSSSVWSAISAYALLRCLKGVTGPFYSTLMNMRIKNEQRSTVLSFTSLINRAHFAIIGLGLGWLAKHHSVSVSYLALGIFSVLLILALGINDRNQIANTVAGKVRS